MKHTPGPWTWDGYELWHTGKGYMPDEKRDPHLYTGILQDRGLSHSETLRANARLIKAAPELLEAFEDILQGYEDFVKEGLIWGSATMLKDYLRQIDAAKAAIAKAKGEAE